MAKIKDYLTDISREIQKNNLGTEEKIKRIEKELQNYSKFPIVEYKDTDTKREKELKQALKYLQKQKDAESIKNELLEYKNQKNKEKLLLNEVYDYFYNDFCDYFSKNKDKQLIYKLAQKSEVIIDSIEQCKKDLFINYEIDLTKTYFKALNQVYNIYKQDIKEEQDRIKEREQRRKNNINRFNNFNKNLTMFNVGVIAISKLSKNYKRLGYSKNR